MQPHSERRHCLPAAARPSRAFEHGLGARERKAAGAPNEENQLPSFSQFIVSRHEGQRAVATRAKEPTAIAGMQARRCPER